jgi:hypothetical protein
MPHPALRCFLLEPAMQARVGLRRFQLSNEPGRECPREGGRWKYHGALVYLADAPLVPLAEAPRPDHWTTTPEGSPLVPDFDWPPHDDPRWPTHCECGYAFTDRDEHQQSWDPLYCRSDTGELTTLREAPPGAMWDAWWYPWKGPDGRSLVVKCPNGHEWCIDSRATNCTLPDDTEHRCWVRHGEPPAITVDKQGLTCAAGAGSILAGDYHGHLRDGAFTPG